MNIDRIAKGDVTYAIVCRGTEYTKGVNFITEQTDDFQVGLMKRPAGHEIQAHTHPLVKRELTTTSEFLFIQEGHVKIKIFDNAWELIKEEDLTNGDFVIFYRGGHALTMLKETKMIEVKQGPFPGDSAAKSFHAAP